MIGSLQAGPPSRPSQPWSSRGPVVCRRNLRRSVCILAAADIPFPRLNGVGLETQGQPLAQEVQKFGARGVFAEGKEVAMKTKVRAKRNGNYDSSLDPEDALPLPMTFPGSDPSPKEAIDAMLDCDVEVQDCKDVIYQWTGECKACRGTGLVSFYRKKHEVTSTCINCLGIGYVNKITGRADIEDMDGTKEQERKSKYKD